MDLWIQAGAVIDPQYAYAYEFSEGLSCVHLQTGEWAMIAPDNTTVLQRPDKADSFRSGTHCAHGLIRCVLTDDDTVVYYDREGKEAFRLQIDGLSGISDFKENGVAFYEVHGSSVFSYDLNAAYGMGLLNARGEILTQPVFYVPDEDGHAEFSEGLFPITEIATLKEGYIDEQGQWVFMPIDGYCQEFRDGLARIYLYPDTAFVDRKGNELCRYFLTESIRFVIVIFSRKEMDPFFIRSHKAGSWTKNGFNVKQKAAVLFLFDKELTDQQ